MGLIKSIFKSTRSTLGDEWLEFIYCDEMPADVLMRKGRKRVAQGSSNVKGSDNIITNGSRIAVNEGQFLLVVDNGKIVDFSDEAGTYIFDKSSEPSLFYGSFGKGLVDTFHKIGQRFAFGGDTGHDQRVYFINKKLITDNKFGTRSPIPFRDSEWNLTVNITCFGTYVYRVVNPLLFYTNLCGNVQYEFKRDEIEEQFKSDLIGSLLPAITKVSTKRISYDMLPGMEDELTETIRASLKIDWEDKTGINIDRIKIENVSPIEEDAKKIQKLQETRVYTSNDFANAAKQMAQADLISGMGQGAAKGGSAGGIEGVAGMMGVAMMGNIMGMGNPLSGAQTGSAVQGWKCECGAVNTGNFCNVCGKPKPQEKAAWICSCGSSNVGNFCKDCGRPRPAEDGSQDRAAPGNTEWICACGAKNTGKFCSECGKPKPAVKRYKCDKCGWQPEDPTKPPKFCPNCGDIFDAGDLTE